MSPKNRVSDNKQKGFSVPEMLVVVVIIGIVAALAIPNFTKANVQLQRQNTARQLKNSFERARFDSIKRNAVGANEMAKVIINSPTSFSSVLDTNLNGRIDSSEIQETSFSASNSAKIVGNNLIFPITITFDHRGQAKATNGLNLPTTPSFIICGQDCTFATANQTNSDTLSISPTGAVALVAAGQVFFDRPIPSISSVKNSDKINTNAKVSN